MIAQSKEAYIFLRDRQRVLENETARSIYILETTFLELREETLAPGCVLELTGAGLFLIPLVGTLKLVHQNSETILDCGNLYKLENQPGLIINHYKEDLVRFLVIKSNTNLLREKTERFPLNLAFNSNNLFTAFNSGGIKILASLMDMRREFSYSSHGTSSVFCYIIQGSAEIEGRLLHDGDGLLLHSWRDVEIESLGPDTILLLLDLS